MLKDIKLMGFGLLFFLCGRLYLLASDYPSALILHSIGLLISLVFINLYLFAALKKTQGPLCLLGACVFIFSIISANFHNLGFRESFILYCVGLHMLIFVSILLINYAIGFSDLKRCFIWACYLFYEIVAASLYCLAQYSSYKAYSFEFLVAEWGKSISVSSAYRSGIAIGLFQDFFIPIFVLFVVFVLSIKLDRFQNSIAFNFDEINDDFVFLLIRKPTGLMDLFYKFRYSLSLYNAGTVYACCKMGVTSFQNSFELNRLNKMYYGINTNIPSNAPSINEELKIICNKKESGLFNCWNSFSEVIGSLKKHINKYQ